MLTRASFFVAATLAQFAAAQPATVEFRIIERHPTPIAIVTGTSNNVLNFAVQARITGTANTGFASCAFSIQMPGEPESAGTLALNTITDTNNGYWSGSIDSTDVSGGRKAGAANAFRYLVGINPAFNGSINASSGSWTNNPTQQDIGLITLATAGSSYLTYTDPQNHGFPDNPLNPATQLQPYFGANANWIDLYRFQYTVTNLSSNRTVPINIFVDGGVQVFATSQMSGGLWGPLSTSPANVIVTGGSFAVSVLGACCDSASALCTINSASGCTSGTFQGVGSSCSTTSCPGGACCTITTGSCAFTGQLGCNGQRTYLGLGTSCSASSCPIGRCCQSQGACSVVIQSACQGVWTAASTCTPNTCPQPGSCCTTTGTCSVTFEVGCAIPYVWTAAGVCTPNTCPPGGACCTLGPCVPSVQSTCTSPGTWTVNATCSPNSCPPAGACCGPTGTCNASTQATCAAGNVWNSSAPCSPNPCPQPGACCAPTGTCTLSLQSACAPGNMWLAGNTCSFNPCPQPGSCCDSGGSCSIVIRPACAGLWGATASCSPNLCAQPHTPIIRTIRAAGPGALAPWNTATTSLSAALAASVPGDEIWIASGTYIPSTLGGFIVPSGVHIYGGFAATETARSQRSANASPTILSGPATHIISTYGGIGQTILDRLTLRAGGGGIVPNPVDAGGGALFATGGTLLVSDCRFEQNHSGITGFSSGVYGGLQSGDGGAAFLSNVLATFTSCVFDQNACSQGMSPNCASGTSIDAPRGGNGGAIAITDAFVRFSSCTFSANSASAGVPGATCNYAVSCPRGGPGGAGGSLHATNTTTAFDACTFIGNAAGASARGGVRMGFACGPSPGGGAGGAIAAIGGSASFTSCLFASNAAGAGAIPTNIAGRDGAPGGSGGAIFCSAASLSLSNCILRENLAGNGGNGLIDDTGCTHPGGAAGTGGAIAATANSTLSILSSTFFANAPGEVGLGASPLIPCNSPNPACCQAGATGAPGIGGIATDSGSLTISSTIAWANINGQIAAPSSTISFSCIQGGATGTANISLDPAFVNSSSGDLRISAISPCIDAGVLAASSALADFAGNPRSVSGCSPLLDSALQSAIDIGALEFQSGSPDCNADGLCDIREVSGLQILRSPTPTTGELFAWSAKVRGSNALIGARGATTSAGAAAGAVYAYTRLGSSWSAPRQLLAADAAANDDFGNWVDCTDDWAVVAARGANAGGLTDSGAVYVFGRSFSGWTQTAKLTAPDALADNLFGHGLAIDQDRIVVGALNGDAPGVPDCGAAYVFRFNGAGWMLEAKLLPADPTPQKGFGISVAISGDSIVVGAPYDGNLGTDGGAAYVFQRFGSSWVQISKLFPTDVANFSAANFGELVAISGDRLIANAPRLNHTGRAQAGAAYVFRRFGSTWVQEVRLTSDAPQAGEWFGFNIAIDADRALIGGFRRTVGGQSRAGSAYVFRRFNTAWLMAARIDPPDPTPFGYYGYSTALSGTRAIIGGHQLPVGSVPSAGSARSFDLTLLDGNHDGIPDSCQISAGTLQDVDANGIPDIVQFNPCRADFNNIGGLSTQDIFDFLNTWFAGDLRADFNGVNALEVQDIFDYLNAWFAGC